MMRIPQKLLILMHPMEQPTPTKPFSPARQSRGLRRVSAIFRDWLEPGSISALLGLTKVIVIALLGVYVAHAANENEREPTLNKRLLDAWTNQTVTVYNALSSTIGTPGIAVSNVIGRQAYYEVPAPRPNASSREYGVVAFIGPYSGKPFVGNKATFYLETDSGIIGVYVTDGSITFGDNEISNSPPGQSIDSAISRFDTQTDGFQWQEKYRSYHTIYLGPILGADFVAAAPGSAQGGNVRLEKVSITKGLLQLDLKNQTGQLFGTIWIDLQTRQLKRAVLNEAEVFPTHSSTLYLGASQKKDWSIQRSTDWTNLDVRLFYTTGKPPRTFPARQANYEIAAGSVYSQGASFGVVAFTDPTNRLLYLGPIATVYIETDSAVVGLSLGLGGSLTWHESFVPDLAESENLNEVLGYVENKGDAWWWQRRSISEARESIMVREILGSDFTSTTPSSAQIGKPELILAKMEGQILQLDLKNQTGEKAASVWIDTRTRKVVRATLNGKDVSLAH